MLSCSSSFLSLFLQPFGKSLLIIGGLDTLLALSQTFSTGGDFVYLKFHNAEEFTWSKNYFHAINAALQLLKFIISFLLWRTILAGTIFPLKLWIVLTISTDISSLCTYCYHISSSSLENPGFEFFDSWTVEFLFRVLLLLSVSNFIGSYLKVEKTREDFKNLKPIGDGLSGLWKFCTSSSTSAEMLIIFDLIWSLLRLLDREATLLIFGHHTLAPSSRHSTAIFTEERIIRIVRVFMDIIFLWNIKKHKTPLQKHWIIVNIIAIAYSIGIFLFIIFQGEDTYPPVVIQLFAISFVCDIIFRTFIFCLCIKSYVELHNRVAASNSSRTSRISVSRK